MLLRRLVDAVRTGDDLVANPIVQRELALLTDLRRAQGYDVEEILTEFGILSDVVFSTFFQLTSKYGQPVEPIEAAEVSYRLQKTLHALMCRSAKEYEARETEHRESGARLLAEYGQAVNHELRNRLNRALMTLSLIRRNGSPSPRVDALMETLRETLHGMDQVAGDIYAVTMSQARSRASFGRPQPLDELIDEVVEDMGPAAVAHFLTIGTVSRSSWSTSSGTRSSTTTRPSSIAGSRSAWSRPRARRPSSASGGST